MPSNYLRTGVAEFVGAFALVFVGAGSIIYGDIVGVALAHGLVIAVMVTAVGHISGGHFNPAVTFGFLITGRIAPAIAAMYWVVQLAGAVLAALLLKWAVPGERLPNLGSPSVSPEITASNAVVIEAVLTFFLVWVIFATVVDPDSSFKPVAGLAIGLTITLGILMAAGLTGAAINPARAFGPMIVSTTWDDWWVWLVGPLAGATIAAVVYEMLFLRDDEKPAESRATAE